MIAVIPINGHLTHLFYLIKNIKPIIYKSIK